MFDYYVRLVKSFVATIDKLSLALHEHAGALRANTKATQEANKEQAEQPQLPSSVSVNLDKTIAISIQGESKTQVHNSWDWRDYLRLGAELVGLLVLIWYAVTTNSLWIESRSQTKIAEQQSRPWIKVTEVTLNTPDTLSYSNPSMMGTFKLFPFEALMMFAPIERPIARANIRATFHLKNIGKSVAQDIRIIVELFFMPNSPTFPVVSKEQERFCALKNIRDSGTEISSRSALFPEDTYTAIINATGWVAENDVSKRDGAEWVRPVVIGCIAYQSPRGFQTRVAYTVAGISSSDVGFRKPLSAEEINFIRDEHSEYAQ